MCLGKKILKIFSLVAIAGLVAFNTYMATDIFKSNGTDLASVFSLSEVMAEQDDGGETGFGYYEDRFKAHVTEGFNGYVKVGADGIITKALGVSFEGGIAYSKEIEYDCCASGGGYCSKQYPKSENVSLLDMIVGTMF
jgi:hypothetical protein